MKGATVELRLYIHMRDPKQPRSIRVSKDGGYRDCERENPFLPTSQIKFVEERDEKGFALIRMPAWLAKDRGLE
ncbi:hypothetical protein DK26_07975 [Bosea sp. WAO]|uniref:hypothetical protein n=1 Tax=Bosea sp. WAO TaxID=406341 RepID=UPI000748C192|nr:hypothetical protein [Bosea sp. WAO]KUL95966.1 hypothetical protein DK26_07975 [Bosea sp. WAO]